MPKLGIEGGLIARLSVKTFLPKAVLGIYDSELLWLQQASREFLHRSHLVVLLTDGFLQIVQVNTCATCWA